MERNTRRQTATAAQVPPGATLGTVRDSSGGVLPGVQVVILNEDTGISHTVQTDTNGYYSAVSLGLGHYLVTGTQEGFNAELRKRNCESTTASLGSHVGSHGAHSDRR